MRTDLKTLFPREPVPPLVVDLVGSGRFDLAQDHPRVFSLVVFYRGRHCPVCRAYLRSLDERIDDFTARGVSVVAISSDTAEAALATQNDWHLSTLRIGYGLPLAAARDWGLFVSSARGKTSLGIEEPRNFIEPGLFLIRPDRTLFFSSVQSMPFARPRVDDLISAIDYVVKNDYPPRGEIIRLSDLEAPL